jgi:DNA-binding CsgD family transcriptional regulator
MSNAQMLGGQLTQLLPPEVHESVMTQFRRAVERGEPTDFETIFVDAGDQLRSAHVQHLPLRDGDAVVGVLTLAFDVRRRPELVHREPGRRLTPRQREILDLVASGLSTAEIAGELTLSPETVRNHLRNASRELGAHNRVEAIATARRVGLLAAPALGPLRPDSGVHPR